MDTAQLSLFDQPWPMKLNPLLALSRTPRVLSYGGGLDSFAMLVESVRRGEPPDVVCFVDVGDPEHARPGEWPGTYRHMREVVVPLCRLHGIPFERLDSTRYPVRDASSLWDWLWARKQIPVAGPNRICTRIAKVERFERWLSDTFGERQVEVWIGFEAGEEARASKDPNAGKGTNAQRLNRFPLMDWQLCRCRCEALVREAGFPVPRKSACVFCPYGSLTDWQTLKRELPEVFGQVVELEARKPPTAENGLKLSIMGYSTKKKNEALERGEPYVPRTLAQWVNGRPTGKRKPCGVCGSAVKATKATGCGYLES